MNSGLGELVTFDDDVLYGLTMGVRVTVGVRTDADDWSLIGVQSFRKLVLLIK